MADEKSGDCGWNEWQNILLNTFKQRLTTVSLKGVQAEPVRNSFTALFLQVKGFKIAPADILQEAIRIIRKNERNDSKFDDVAMMGHRIGIIENIVDLKQYFQDTYKLLKPEGQILLTSVNVLATNQHGQKSYQLQNMMLDRYLGESDIQIECENLIGPFFSLLRFKTETLKSQAALTNWKYEELVRQNDDNFLARLSLRETE